MNRNKNRVIALDVDGVLLDYHEGYRMAWELAFGEPVVLKFPNRYWPRERYDLPLLEGQQLEKFRSVINGKLWKNLNALPGAVDSCNRLVEVGFTLICVSAIEPEFIEDRKVNLLNLGFPISKVFATGGQTNQLVSPKAKVLNELLPEYFVDDFLPYLRGLHGVKHRALIDAFTENSPNKTADKSQWAHSEHKSLREFTDWLLTK